MNMRAYFLGLFVAVLVSGCITHTSVKKVTDENRSKIKGQRVHLPAPFIVGRPAPDGTVKYTVELMPDPNQEYAIHTWSFMAKQKAEIARTIEMYVQKVTLTQDTSAVAAQLAASAGAVGKSAIDSLVDKEKSKATSDAAEAKARADAVTAKAAAVEEKKAALEKAKKAVASAEAALDEAEKSKDATAIKEANKTLAEKKLLQANAEIDLKFAEAALADAQKAALVDTKKFDAPIQQQKASGNPKVPGIIIYEIIESATRGVELRPLTFKLFSAGGVTSGVQLRFETRGEKKSEKEPAAPKPPNLDVDKITIDKFAGQLTRTIQFDAEVEGVLKGETTVKDANDVDVSQHVEIAADSKTSVKITFKQTAPPGKYILKIMVRFKDARTFPYPVTATVK
jgi:hypothetical protein